MPNVSVQFHEGSGLRASFEGVVDPDGAEGYVFSGKVRAICALDRSSTDFENTVEFGHGGESGDYTYVAYRPEGGEENVWAVEGKGQRKKNEPVDFKIGMNTGLSGQFSYGKSVTATPGGPRQEIDLFLHDPGWDVQFNGFAWADGPTGYVIQGKLSRGKLRQGSWESEQMTFGYKTSSGSWEYKTTPIDKGVNVTVRGSRKDGERIQVLIGTTTKTFNRYNYSDEVSLSLPAKF